MSLTGFLSYSRVNWQQSPSKSTPWNATNLNIMDKGIKDNNDMISNLRDEVTQLNSNISNNNIEGTFKYLGLELVIYNKSGIRYLRSQGRLTQAFPTAWTTIGQVNDVKYTGYGHLTCNTSGSIIKFSYTNGALYAYAINPSQNNEYIQDSCTLI